MRWIYTRENEYRKVAIIYASVHHENTNKVVEAIAGENVVDLTDAVTFYKGIIRR